MIFKGKLVKKGTTKSGKTVKGKFVKKVKLKNDGPPRRRPSKYA